MTARLTAAEHNDLGVAYHAGRRYDLAAQQFGRALALRPDWPRALGNLGTSRLALGDVPGAIAAYERAAVLAPEDPIIANNLAWALLQDEARWPEAEPLIAVVLARGSGPLGYYLDTLGYLRLRQGQPAQALDAFRAALADPAAASGAIRAQVLEHAGLALAALGDPVGAERCYRRARSLPDAGAPAPDPGPPDPEAQGALARVGRGDTVC